MKLNLLDSKKIYSFFQEREYNCLKSFPVVNNNDTIFITAGIQPILKSYTDGNISDSNNIFIAQPVIRTQYVNSIEEGYSISFVNVTTAGFNNSEEEYFKMIKDWYEFLEAIGIYSKRITTLSDTYEDNWGNLNVIGKRTFHYYKDIELGDTTFFTSITSNNKKLNINSMCDLGFGLERLRWLSTEKSYFDLYTTSKELNSDLKAYLSVIALLAVNNVVPSNKSSGYRARLFSKKVVSLLEANVLNEEENKYLNECIKYWLEFQSVKNIDKNIINNEYIRNGNRFIIDLLTNEGYKNLSGINVNISREELNKRLLSSGVEEERVKRLWRRIK